MASRDEVSFQGVGVHRSSVTIDGVTITYDATKVGGSAQVGLAAMWTDDGQIALTSDGAAVAGRIASVEWDGVAALEDDGYVELPAGSGATVTMGMPVVGDLGPSNARGYVRAADSTVAAELAKARGEIIANNDTTALVVKL